MEMCARCHKRVAVVYVTKIENGETVTEGICLKCAKELGIKPVNDILEKMGVSPDSIDELDHELEDITEKMTELVAAEPEADADDSAGRAPSINISQLFDNFGFGKPGQGAEKTDKKPSDKPKGAPSKLKYLTNYCKNLTSSARDGKLDRIVGRERELDRVIQILSRRQKNNPCLIGEPGVGKTASAEALALKIAEGVQLFTCNDRTPAHKVDSAGLMKRAGEQLTADDFFHEQYLLLEEEGRKVLISGCSHKGVLNVMAWVKPDVLVGGFHFSKIEPERLAYAAEALQQYPCTYFTCHCTGIPQFQYLQGKIGEQLRYLATGDMAEV